MYDAEGTNTIRQEAHLRRARLFVGNVDPVRVHRRDILHRFQEYGEVMGISLHQGYAFVQMDSERNANRAVNFENGAKINSTRLREPCPCNQPLLIFSCLSPSTDVEFSSAALNAGARCKPLSLSVFLILFLPMLSFLYTALTVLLSFLCLKSSHCLWRSDLL